MCLVRYLLGRRMQQVVVLSRCRRLVMCLLLSRLWRRWLLWKPHMHPRWMPFGLRLRLGWRWSVRKLMPLPRRLMWQPPVLSFHAMVSQLLLLQAVRRASPLKGQCTTLSCMPS